jgi:hypothetical protein
MDRHLASQRRRWSPRKICDALQAVRIFFSAGEVRIMPKAIRFNRLGGPEVLHMEDLPERQPGPGEVLLKVEAVGLNRAESMYYHGFYLEKTNLPSGLGYEAVGKVIAVGPEVDPTLIGKRFGTIPGFSMNQYPVLAEEAVVLRGRGRRCLDAVLDRLWRARALRQSGCRRLRPHHRCQLVRWARGHPDRQGTGRHLNRDHPYLR